MILYMNPCRLGWLCGLYHGDATGIAVCSNKRIHSNKVFLTKAKHRKSSTGWFYGFKPLKGWAFCDKGFINQSAFEQLLKKGLQVITGIRTNMKNKLMNYQQKIYSKKEV